LPRISAIVIVLDSGLGVDSKTWTGVELVCCAVGPSDFCREAAIQNSSGFLTLG
jgi:hypothetical protein